MRANLMMVVLLLTGGCATTQMSKVEVANQAYLQSQEAEKLRAQEAEAARRAAEAAQAQRESRGLAFGTAIHEDATSKAEAAATLVAQAEQQRRQACQLNPSLCPQTAPPAAVGSPPPAVPTEDPTHVDLTIKSFSLSGLTRLTDYPPGWKVTCDAATEEITLTIGGKRALTWRKDSAFEPGCWRIFATHTVKIDCPTAQAGDALE